MKLRTIVIAALGTALGVVAGCACPSIGGGFQPVVAGDYVVDDDEFALQFNGFDWLPTDYRVQIDESGESVTETYEAADGTHIRRYRVVTTLHLHEDYGYRYQVPEEM